MEQDLTLPTRESKRIHFSRAFRPLAYWLLISLFLLAWDFHRKHAPRTTLNLSVRIEGEEIPNSADYQAIFRKRRVGPGLVAPIGWGTLHVSIPDAVPQDKEMFVWYGVNHAGPFDLKWEKGVLDLKVEPAARTIRFTGPHHSFSLANSSGTTVSVPVGTYRVSAAFDHISEEHQIRIDPNETNPFVIKPNLGYVRVQSAPGGAKFSLSARSRNPLTMQGDVPAFLTGLPVGDYQLRVWRGDYIKESSVAVKKWETNQVNVVFEYGQVNIGSEPDGATIFSGARQLGQTPTTLNELKPGSYTFRLEKTGYVATEVNLELKGTNSITISTNLVNIRSMQGMTAARRELSASSPDYKKALASVEQALSENPTDAAAIALKSQIEVGLAPQVKREAQEAETAALTARKRGVKQTFDQTISSIPQTELYDAHLWEFRAPLANVREALLRTITKTTIKWSMGNEVRENDETLIFYATSKGFLTSGKRFVILVSQVDSNLVHVHAKFWDYTMATSRAIPAYRGKSDVPLNVKFFIPEERAHIEARRREIPENVHSVLQQELQ